MGSTKNALERLPIFRLGKPRANAVMLHELAARLLAIDRYTYREDDERLVLRSGHKVIEVYRCSGGIWAADEAHLWNHTLDPKLPEERQARAIADEFFRKHQFLSGVREPFVVAAVKVGGTYLSTFDVARKARRDRRLDVQVTYSVGVALKTSRGESLQVPVLGGGFTVTLGDGGQVIGFNGVWRPVEPAALDFEVPVVPQAEADEQFRTLTSRMNIRSFDSYLAYYAAPASSEQQFLYPVYVYQATAEIRGHRVPLRLITLPATRFGPPARRPQSQPKRVRKARPAATVAPAVRRGLQSLNVAARAVNPFEAGTSWIGLSGGLGGSQNNAKGFVDGLAADGWLINFNWGDGNAWESDWRRNDDDWVDAADFVFYTGHASMDGWVLSNPDDGFLSFTEVGAIPQSPGDLWGQQDLEWVIIAACGPLQDEVLAVGGGDVFKRWQGAFDGLHLLLGYGAITFDNEDEGKLVVKYAREGQPLINAWLRTAKEVQPSDNGAGAPDGPTVWAGVMWVERSGVLSPASDHLWGHGSVAPDPTSPNVYVAMWTPT